MPLPALPPGSRKFCETFPPEERAKIIGQSNPLDVYKALPKIITESLNMPIPRGKARTNKQSFAVTRAYSAIGMVSNLPYPYLPDELGEELFLPLLPKFMAWIAYLERDDATKEVAVELSGCLALLAAFPKIALTMLASRDFIQMAVRLWLQEALYASPERASATELFTRFKAIKGNPKWVDEVIDAVGLPPEKFASIAVRRVRSTLTIAKSNPSPVFASIDFLLAILGPEGEHHIANHLFAEDAVPIVTKALCTLAAVPPENGDDEWRVSMARGIGAAIAVVCHMAGLQSGATVLIQSFRSGLLTGLLDAARWTKYIYERDLKYLRVLIITQFSRYFIYQSVLLVLDHKITTLEKQGIDTANFASYHKDLSDLWAVIRLFARHRIEIMKKMGGRWLSSPTCGNENCKNTRVEREEFYVCTGCRDEEYCSQACQKAAWRQGHKEKCTTLRKSRRGGSDVFLKSDLRFIVTLAGIDAADQYESASAKAGLTNLPLSEKVMFIDYESQPPVECSIIRRTEEVVEKISAMSSRKAFLPEFKDVDEFSCDVNDDSKGELLAVVVFARGTKVIRHPFRISKDTLEANKGLYGIPMKL